MSTNYTVNTKIEKPLPDVFQAVIKKELLTKYFADKCSDNLNEGQQIVWHWNEWGDYPVTVKKVIKNQLIELGLDAKAWKKTEAESYEITVLLKFEALNEQQTMVSISEQGWPQDQQGLTGSYENCGGWMHMLMCLKAYLEHGIDLR